MRILYCTVAVLACVIVGVSAYDDIIPDQESVSLQSEESDTSSSNELTLGETGSDELVPLLNVENPPEEPSTEDETPSSTDDNPSEEPINETSEDYTSDQSSDEYVPLLQDNPPEEPLNEPISTDETPSLNSDNPQEELPNNQDDSLQETPNDVPIEETTSKNAPIEEIAVNKAPSIENPSVNATSEKPQNSPPYSSISLGDKPTTRKQTSKRSPDALPVANTPRSQETTNTAQKVPKSHDIPLSRGTTNTPLAGSEKKANSGKNSGKEAYKGNSDGRFSQPHKQWDEEDDFPVKDSDLPLLFSGKPSPSHQKLSGEESKLYRRPTVSSHRKPKQYDERATKVESTKTSRTPSRQSTKYENIDKPTRPSENPTTKLCVGKVDLLGLDIGAIIFGKEGISKLRANPRVMDDHLMKLRSRLNLGRHTGLGSACVGPQGNGPLAKVDGAALGARR
ncbi:hypothetical protein DSO57_1015700 [Entomophthora muscae]|uniref:Uncharacterized protein n=1 Tax=Entomophthora muscae TaxID=34485 RepID=A0ACC2S712_9FUNG|nr:hypothetical protein DSO57_1015700 [Entomophthora muscae]